MPHLIFTWQCCSCFLWCTWGFSASPGSNAVKSSLSSNPSLITTGWRRYMTIILRLELWRFWSAYRWFFFCPIWCSNSQAVATTQDFVRLSRQCLWAPFWILVFTCGEVKSFGLLYTRHWVCLAAVVDRKWTLQWIKDGIDPTALRDSAQLGS